MKINEQIIGLQRQSALIKKQIETKSYASTYIFHGANGTQKRQLRDYFIQLLMCSLEKDKPCLQCIHCKSINNGSHPDIRYVDADAEFDGSSIDVVRSITSGLTTKPLLSDHRIISIENVHKLSNTAVNAFLKYLEEPPSHAVIILLTDHIEKLPGTILSRCQLIKCTHISEAELTDWIDSIELSVQAKVDLVHFASGNPGRARELMSDNLVAHSGYLDQVFRLVNASSSESYNVLNDIIKSYKSESKESKSAKGMQTFLQYLLTVFHDGLFLKFSQKLTSSEEYKLQLRKLIDKYSVKQLSSAMFALNLLMSERWRNLNIQLGMENLLLKLNL